MTVLFIWGLCPLLEQPRPEAGCAVGQVKGHPNGLDDLPLPLE